MQKTALLASMHTVGTAVRAQLTDFFEAQFSAAQADTLGAHLPESLERLKRYTTHQGKFIRPWLVVQGYLLAKKVTSFSLKDIPQEVLQVAGAVELFHRYLLNLDDMADRDYVRHGEPTLEVIHRQRLVHTGDPLHHGRTISEIEGALLCSLAYELLNQPGFSATQLNLIVTLVNTTIFRSTVAGWQIHYYQNFEPLAAATEDEFVQGLELVTARYTFEAPLMIGLVLGGAALDGELAQTLRSFSKQVGIGYQLSDDILGLFGESEKTGKPVGNDVREGKKTLLLQRAYQLSNPTDQQFLNAVVGTDCSAEELVRVQTIVTSSGALVAVQTELKNYLERASSIIQPIAGIGLLVELVDYIAKRKY